MKKKTTLRVVINEKDTRAVLKSITGLAMTRFQKAISSRLEDLTKNIDKGNKTDLKKAFYNTLRAFEDVGSDLQDILPLIEDMMDLPIEEDEKSED